MWLRASGSRIVQAEFMSDSWMNLGARRASKEKHRDFILHGDDIGILSIYIYI